MKLLDYFRKVHNKLFRKKARGTIWSQKFDGVSTLSHHLR